VARGLPPRRLRRRRITNWAARTPEEAPLGAHFAAEVGQASALERVFPPNFVKGATAYFPVSCSTTGANDSATRSLTVVYEMP
jgi:hypothetical protein